MSFKVVGFGPVAASQNPPILVLFHGYGSNELDLLSLGPELDPSLLILSVRAPIDLPFGGHAWFNLEFDASGVSVSDVDEAKRSLQQVIAFLRELLTELRVDKVGVAGFSQGAMMALGVALQAPEMVRGVAVMSGRWLPAFHAEAHSVPLGDLPILIQHGIRDEVIPISHGRELVSNLKLAGRSADYREYDMGHEISFSSLSELRMWLAAHVLTA